VCALTTLGCRRPEWQKTYFEAETKFRAGESDSALRLIQDQFEQSQNSDPLWTWKFRILKAEVLLRKHAPDKAEALLEPEIPSDLRDTLGIRKQIIQAHALCTLNEVTESTHLLDRAAKQVPETDRTGRAQLELVRGYCEFPANHLLARQHFENSAVAAHGADKYIESRALGALGFTLMLDRHLDEAIEKLSAASSITDSPWLLEALLGDLGECYQELGDWKTAISYSQQAEKLAAQVKDAVEDRVRWLIDLGREHYSQVEYPEAEKSWSSALALAAGLASADLKGRCLNNLSMLALKRGDKAAAEEYIKQVEALHLQGGQELYLLLYKARLAQLEDNRSEAEFLLSQILSKDPNSQVKYEAETDLAAVYVSERKFVDAERMFRAGISTAEQAFSSIGSDQFRISYLDYLPFYDEYVRFLIAQNRALEALSIAEHGRSRALGVGLGLEVKQELNITRIQDNLRDRRQVVLAYWLAAKESYLWVITPTESKLLKLPSEIGIDKAIDAYTQEVLDISTPEESGLGQKLYQMLVAPAEKYIPKGSRVIIVPHRRLYKLNFETLVSPRPKPHFWIEDVCIQNASFLAVLENPKRTEPYYSKDLLLMGAPVQASKDFPGLAHAPEEIQKVSAHFQHAKETVIEGKQATPDAYDSSNPRQYRFFHFVTHGTASDANPLDSAIILSPSSDGYKLYARDIIKTRIHPQLVTISTCYGAGTRQYSGEGLVGLAWAFMRVGAHQVVAALWEVDDAANADLMDQFYSELTRGKTAAAALRDGKLAMLHSAGPRKRPYYWSSLQLYTGP
jgi:CHAT domain-containing protein